MKGTSATPRTRRVSQPFEKSGIIQTRAVSPRASEESKARHGCTSPHLPRAGESAPRIPTEKQNLVFSRCLSGPRTTTIPLFSCCLFQSLRFLSWCPTRGKGNSPYEATIQITGRYRPRERGLERQRPPSVPAYLGVFQQSSPSAHGTHVSRLVMLPWSCLQPRRSPSQCLTLTVSLHIPVKPKQLPKGRRGRGMNGLSTVPSSVGFTNTDNTMAVINTERTHPLRPTKTAQNLLSEAVTLGNHWPSRPKGGDLPSRPVCAFLSSMNAMTTSLRTRGHSLQTS